jgi:hypothetical protein
MRKGGGVLNQSNPIARQYTVYIKNELDTLIQAPLAKLTFYFPEMFRNKIIYSIKTFYNKA